ncbi:FIST N-terminal domain-containing protein, partial [Enhygromyxa salina]|uniref:FIST N-terminal domain-containing protein n=1 Tax=Enhygromyxa salina TaxID=215803 RepID=UPI001C62A34F
MRWASSISDAGELEEAVERTTDELRQQLAGSPADLVLVFAARGHQQRWHELPAAIRERMPGAVILGCSGGGVLANGRELEGTAGLAMAAAWLPGVELTPFHLPAERTPD